MPGQHELEPNPEAVQRRVPAAYEFQRRGNGTQAARVMVVLP